MSSLGGGDQSSSASSVADVSSVAHSHFDTAIPEGTRCYLLLCVNSEIHRIDLAHIDLTTKFEYGIPVPTDDQSLFQGVRDEYRRLRGSKLKNIFVIPKTIQFIKVCESHSMTLWR